MKNRKIYFGFFIIIFLFGFCLIIKENNRNYNSYTNLIINNNAYLIESIIKNHPELEEEIINNIISEKNNTNGLQILEKYGLDESDIMINYKANYKSKTLKRDITLYIIFVLIIIAIYIFYLINENKKIKQINKYIEDILNNKDTFDIRDYNEDVLSKLKNDIYKITNLLKEEKEKTIKEKKNLENTLSDISHQIKTPLTSMYVINDLLFNDKLDKNKKKEFLNKNRLQLERIEWLVTSLLKISRLDSGVIKLKKEQVKITDLIIKSLEPLKIPIELKKQEIIIDIPDNLKIKVDINWTVEALINILKNAHEHTNKNGIIEIKAIENPIYTEITIKDNGEGIDESDISHIFERFYKANNNKESIGIGLNMAKTIIEKENGQIEVESKKNKYTDFKIKFYKTKWQICNDICHLLVIII